MALTAVTATTSAIGDLNQYRNHLQGAVGSTEAWHLRVATGENFQVTLADSGGVQDFRWNDSGGTRVGGVDSDGNADFAGTLGVTGAATLSSTLGVSGAVTVTSAAAAALAVGANGNTNPVLRVVASTASVATGISITGAAATGRVAVAVLSSGANEGLDIDALGSGTIRVGNTSTGAITLARATTVSAGDFTVSAGQLLLPLAGASGGVLIGGDFLIYRLSADFGYTPDTFQVGGAFQADGQSFFPATGSGGGLVVGGDAQWFRGAANRMDLASGDSLNIVSGNLTVAGAGTFSAGNLVVDRTGAANASLTLDSDDASQNSELRFEEGGTFRYIFYYSNANNWLAINTTDSDGIGSDADVIRIPDGQLSVDGNTTFDANAFDYVCDSCGRHEAESFTCCGLVEWHDDVALMSAITRTPLHTGDPTGALAQMERLGLMRRYDDGKVFTSLNRMPMFLMSGMVQQAQSVAVLRETVEGQARYIAELHKRLAERGLLEGWEAPCNAC